MKSNPFTIGILRNEYEHYGRKYQVSRLLADKRNILLVGNRRSGKSWLLCFLEQQLSEKKDWCGFSVDLSGRLSSLEMGGIIMQRYWECIHADREQDEPFIAPEVHVYDALRQIDYESKVNGQHCFVLLDEGEQLLSLSDAALGKLRGTISYCRHLNVIIAGSRRMYRLYRQPSIISPFLNNFVLEFIRPLTFQDISALIRQKQNPDLTVQVVPDLLSELQVKCGCQPFLVQRLCFYLYQDGTLEINELENYLSNDDLLEKYFENDYDSLSPEQQKLLLRASFELAKEISTLSAETGIEGAKTHKAVHELHQLGMLKSPEKGKYLLENYFLAQWVGQKKESLTVDFKKQVRQLIADGKIKQAMEELLDNTEKSRQKELHNDLIILSSTLKIVQSDRVRGTIDNGEHQKQMARIKHSLLYYLDQFNPDNT